MSIITSQHLNLLAYELSKYVSSGQYKESFDSDEVATCVVQHSAAAAVASMAAGILPGAGSLISMGISIGAIWAMYIRICKIIHIKLSKNKLKALASAVLSNIITQIGALIAAEVLIGFLPGASIVICGLVNFVAVYFAGIIFIKALTTLFKAGKGNVESMSVEALKSNLNNAAKDTNAKDVIKEAKGVFKNMRKDGSLEDVGKSVDINPDDSN